MVKVCCGIGLSWFFFFQAEDGIRDLVRSRGLGDVYKRQDMIYSADISSSWMVLIMPRLSSTGRWVRPTAFSLSLIHI